MKLNGKTLLLSLCLFALTPAARADELSPNVSTFATGLIFPRGLEFGPDGNLYVAEAGTGGSMQTLGQCDQVPPPLGPSNGGFTARISKITPGGARSTVADHLPSNTDSLVGDAIGIADVTFIGDTLYALSSGAGCSQGLANTNNAVLRVNSDGTTTQVGNLSAFVLSHPAAQIEPADFTPDGTFYNMLAARGDFYVIESNSGELLKVNQAGLVSRLVDFSATEGHWVPTALAYDGDFYVANLGVFPTLDGASKILKVTPDGQVTEYAKGLTAVLSLAFDALHRLYVLETSTGNDFPTEGAGKIIRLDNAGKQTEIATGLSFPTAMTFGPDGNLYVSHRGYTPPNMGEIVKVNLQPATPHLANMSARGLVQSGDNVLIGGLIINGGGVQRVLVRAVGPSLSAAHVANALPDPTVALFDSNGVRKAFNNNWQDNATQAALITTSGKAPANALEAAIVADLSPGAYTAVVASNTNATGVALVEFYALDPITGSSE